MKQKKRSGDVNEAFVIDGQQRLTTLSILLKSIYDCFDEDLQKNTEAQFRSFLFYKVNATDSDWQIKINHSKNDKFYFEKVINANGMLDNPTDNLIIACYNYFITKLNLLSKEDKIKLFNKLVSVNNKMLVVIDIREDEDEQAIFDTINTAGVKLTTADSIKNNVFQRGFEIFGINNKKVEDLYEENWQKIFLEDEETIKFWSQERTTGRMKRANLEIFLQSYAIIKGIYEPTGNTLANLTNEYKRHFNNNIDESNYEATLKEIAEYAKLYKTKIYNCDLGSEYSHADTIKRLFLVLDVAEVTTFHAYILYLFHEIKDENNLKQKLLEFEQYIVYNAITDKTEKKKNYNKLCVEFIKGTKTPKDDIGRVEREDILVGLSKVTNNMATLWLFCIELYRRSLEKGYDRDSLNYVYSLEHIMPQKWEQYWSDVDFVDENGNVLPNDELSKAKRKQKIYELGNMTLLKSKLNTAISNYTMDRKINGEGKKKGLKAYVDLTITQKDIIEAYNNGINWNEQAIGKRTNLLTDELMSCFKF
jgi:hypothetical protein